jgi:hypothetical protein
MELILLDSYPGNVMTVTPTVHWQYGADFEEWISGDVESVLEITSTYSNSCS